MYIAKSQFKFIRNQSPCI